jgi:hypothetical protein
VPGRLTELGARLILASRALDVLYRRLDRARSELVLALASDMVLTRFNELAYADTGAFDPNGPGFRHHLFPWEEAAVERFFPPPPARLLVGAAGGGREPFALARRGYEVMAFEPARYLAAGMAAHVPHGTVVRAYEAGYEDMPHLRPVVEGAAPLDLSECEPFDAAILGWASLSHVRTEEQRLRTLVEFGRVTAGPILASFFPGADHPPKPGRLRRLIRGPLNQDTANTFSPYIGFYHGISPSELTRLAEAAGLDVLHLDPEDNETNWPHAVLRRRAAP